MGAVRAETVRRSTRSWRAVPPLAAVLVLALLPSLASAHADAVSYHVQRPRRAGSIQSLGCYAATCLGAGYGTYSRPAATVVTINHGKARAGQPVKRASALWGATCATSSYCIAVGQDDHIHTSRWNGHSGEGNGRAVGIAAPVVDGRPRAMITLRSMIAVTGVACPAVRTCLVTGEDQPPHARQGHAASGALIVITNRHPGRTQVVPGTLSITQVTCPSASRCLAIGQTFEGGSGIIPVTDGAVGSLQVVRDSKPDGIPSALGYIGCATATRCVGTAASATMAILDGHPSPWMRAPRRGDGYGPVGCWSSQRCLTIGPPGGKQLHPVAVSGKVGRTTQIKNGHFYAVACWSPRHCLLGGFDYGESGHEQGALIDFAPADLLR